MFIFKRMFRGVREYSRLEIRYNQLEPIKQMACVKCVNLLIISWFGLSG